MPLNNLYSYDTNWNPGPIYGGWLAAEREHEMGLARLMEQYKTAQALQENQQKYKQAEQMNPLEIQGKTLANQLQGQTYNTNRPKEMVAQANAQNPEWLKGELAQQDLEGKAKTAEAQGKIQGLTRAAVMNTLEKWITKQPSPLEMQFDIKDFNDQDKQMLMELYKNPKGYLEKMREQDAQRAWQAKKMETEEETRRAYGVADRNAAASLAAAKVRASTSNKPRNPRTIDEATIANLNAALAANEITQEQYDEAVYDLFNKKYNAKVQPGPGVQFDEQGKPKLGNKEIENVTPPARKGSTAEPKPAATAKRRVWDSKANKWVEQ
jgi:hypothetical protein